MENTIIDRLVYDMAVFLRKSVHRESVYATAKAAGIRPETVGNIEQPLRGLPICGSASALAAYIQAFAVRYPIYAAEYLKKIANEVLMGEISSNSKSY